MSSSEGGFGVGLLFLGVLGIALWKSAAGKVMKRERANGTDGRLQRFLDYWAVSGPFALMVAPDGGVRTNEARQASYYAAGTSKARTLDETPHGRGGAVDLWPEGFDPTKPVDEATYQRFLAIGAAAERAGLGWGGRWTGAFPPSTANPYGGDLPHVEVRDWASLPYPPEVTV